jgi:hypothetical protein
MKRTIKLTESDLARIVKRVIKEEENVNDGKNELIDSLIKSLNFMKTNPKYDALLVAQIIYNNCAQWMNKGSYFSDRPGNPTKNKAPFAPNN